MSFRARFSHEISLTESILRNRWRKRYSQSTNYTVGFTKISHMKFVCTKIAGQLFVIYCTVK